jgi:Domain of unknown function (DUF5919)
MRRLTPQKWVYLLLHVILFILGVLLVREKNAVMSGVGASLVAAAVAGWVLFVWVMASQTQAKRLELIADLGLVDAFSSRAATIKTEYDSRLADARRSIDIMGFGLRQLREDYGGDFATWASKAKVRILLLDPTTPNTKATYASQRDKEEGNPTGSIAGDVKAFLAQTEALRVSNPNNFEVRLYTALPSINICRVDDSIFWGPYLVRRQSRSTPTFLVKRGGSLFDEFQSHFEAIWSDDQLSRAPTVPNSSPGLR